MQYLKGINAYQDIKPSAVTLGKFDGLHRGHELLISRVETHQNADDVVGIVIAFDMRPLWEKLGVQRDMLMTNEEKAKRLEGRVDYFIDCPFDETVSSIEAEMFIEEILVNHFHAKYIVVGSDFRFGHNKRGDYRMLQAFGEKYNYQVEVIDKICYEGREISSSYIKEELKKGNQQLANHLLGYRYDKKES